MNSLDFIAIDFETATGKRASICEAGICLVKDVVRLQKPNRGWYDLRTMFIHIGTSKCMAYIQKIQRMHLNFLKYGQRLWNILLKHLYW